MNQIVGAGKKVRTARSKTTRILQVENKDIEATAEIYSRACIAKSLLAGESLQDLTAVYSNLAQLYYQVLTSPNDPKVRQELAKRQVSIRVPDHALYQLARAEKYSPETDHFLKAEIYVTKGAAYSQLKMNDRSAELYQKARSYDSEIFDKMDLKSLRVEYDPKREIVPVARDDQKRYLDLLDKGDFKAAIAGFEKRIRSNNANSIDSYGLAYGYMNLKDDKLAAKYASNALTLNEKDGRLLPKQIEFCKKIVDSLKSGKINRYDRR